MTAHLSLPSPTGEGTKRARWGYVFKKRGGVGKPFRAIPSG